MTQPQLIRRNTATQADTHESAQAADPALTRVGTALNPEAAQAARILHTIHGMPFDLGLRLALEGDSSDARKVFHLNSEMNRQQVVVSLTNQVGLRALQQAYLTLTRRQLTVDFKQELASTTASRAGFRLGSPDQARLTNLMLDNNAEQRWVVGHELVDKLGQQDNFGADILQGSTRKLAYNGMGVPPLVRNAAGRVRDAVSVASSALGLLGVASAVSMNTEGAKITIIDDPAVIDALITHIESADKAGDLDSFLKNFAQQRGKSIYAYLGEVVRDPGLRQRVLDHLPQPISSEQLTTDAFLENIALGLVYDNHPGAQLEGASKGYRDPKRGGQAPSLLDQFGYRASDVYAGKWGFEMRVFTPIPGKAKSKDAIIAFRGTEGLQFDLSSDASSRGTLDTQIGDFSPAAVGYNQFQQNEALIDHVIGKVGKDSPLLMTGHSLGGALAQLAAVRYRTRTRRVVTFQSANIDQADVDLVKEQNHRGTPMLATHYRVDGDVVPTAGEAAIPGNIHYFDADWKLKGETEFHTGLKRTTDRASLGHVIPVLSMYLQGLDVPKDQTALKTLQDQGIKDELAHRGKADVRVTYSGKYDATRDAKQDPRVNLEAGRDNASAFVKTLTTLGVSNPKFSFRAVYEEELPYNTLLSQLEKAATDARDYPAFQARALQLMGLSDQKYGTVSLEVGQKDKDLGEQLGVRAPDRVDVKRDTLEKILTEADFISGRMNGLKMVWGNYR